MRNAEFLPYYSMYCNLRTYVYAIQNKSTKNRKLTTRSYFILYLIYFVLFKYTHHQIRRKPGNHNNRDEDHENLQYN